MRRFNILILTHLLSICFGAEGSSSVTFNGFQVSNVENQKKLTYNNRGYDLKQVNQNGINYVQPIMEKAGSVAQPGQPYLPTVSTMYAVEPGKKFEVQIIIKNVEIIENVDILPLEGWGNNLTGNAVKLSLIHI